MRRPVDEDLARAFFRAFGSEARAEARVYVTRGVSAVLLGWCSSTVGLDLRFTPEHDSLFRAIPTLKESLQVNVELASPADFTGFPRSIPLQFRRRIEDVFGRQEGS